MKLSNYRKNFVVLVITLTIVFATSCDENNGNFFGEKEHQERLKNPLGALNFTAYNGLQEIYVSFSYDGTIFYYTTTEYIYDHFTWIWQYYGDSEMHFWHLGYVDLVTAGQLPFLSGENQYVAYSGVEWGGWEQDVYRFDAMNPGEHIDLTTLPYPYQAFAESWQHNGDYLVCLSDKDREDPHGLSNPEIYLLHKDGNTPEHPMIRLTWTDAWYEYPNQPVISPDDQWVYYWSYHGQYPNQHSDLWKVKTDGSGERFQIDFPDTYGIVRINDISPDGRFLAISREIEEDELGIEWQIAYVSVDGGEPRMFFEPISFYFGKVAFVPGYDLIAFISDLDDPGGESDIYVYPFNPDEEISIVDFSEMERFKIDFNL